MADRGGDDDDGGDDAGAAAPAGGLPADLVASLAALICAVDPAGLGGVLLRARAGPARDAWLALLRRHLPDGAPWRRVPLHIADEGLLGGLDLAATLHLGRPIARRGLLAESHGGMLLLAMAERTGAGLAARVTASMDTGVATLERDGLGRSEPARFGVVALDEGCSDDEQVPAALAERLAIHLVLGPRAAPPDLADADVAAARALLPAVHADDAMIQALCEAAQQLGIESLRAPSQALRVACIAAALRGVRTVDAEDAALAARLVFGPRARRMPPPPEAEEQAAPPAEADDPPAEPPPEPPDADAATPPPESDADDDRPPPPADAALEDRLLEAAAVALPPSLLAAIAAGLTNARRAGPIGRAGVAKLSFIRGRPIGAVRGELRAGARLDLLQTLRAAAPWQRLRRAAAEAARGEAQALARAQAAAATRRRPARAGAPAAPRHADPAVRVHRDDFHIRRFRQHNESTTLFAVDASGSQALHRLAEAKGAVELLLAECYVRRDRVAVLAFRGNHAEILLPPTRSLVRAKRCLVGLPGGGGTPLAAGIDAALAVAEGVARGGGTPLLVLLTDGRANIARDGSPGRPQAQADALAAARGWQLRGHGALLLDTGPQPAPQAAAIALAMGARYLALPNADAHGLARAVAALTAPGEAAGSGRG